MEVLNNRYIIEKQLGKGSFSTVYLVSDIFNDNKYALRMIKKSSFKRNIISLLYSEFSILNKLRIIGKDNEILNSIPIYHQIYESKYKNSIYIFVLMEYIPGITLEQLINSYIKNDKTFDINYSIELLKKLSKIIYFLHKNNIVHRDIKPENIMIDEKNNRIVLIDFGFACSVNIDDPDYCQYNQGSPLYIAPEYLIENNFLDIAKKENNLKILKKGDIWSLGITFFNIYTQKTPYPESIENILQLIQYLKNGNYPYIDENIDENIEKNIDENIEKNIENYSNNFLSQLINNMLSIEPIARPSAKKIIEEINTYKNKYNFPYMVL